MNGIQQWAKDHKEEREAAKNQVQKSEFAGQKVRKIAEEELIVLAQVPAVNEAVFDFKQADGTVRKTKRYFYTTGKEYDAANESTWALLVPASVHNEICDLMEEYGPKLRAVKVKRSGNGINTEYKTFPQFV